MINYNSIWYEAWNSSHIRHHFSSFNYMIKMIKKYKQSYDDWVVVIHDTVNHYRFHSLPHKVSALSFYDAEDGYRNIGKPLVYMIPDDMGVEDVKTWFEFECDFNVDG